MDIRPPLRAASLALIALGAVSLLLMAANAAFDWGGEALAGASDELIVTTMVAAGLASLGASWWRRSWRWCWRLVGIASLLYAAGQIDFFYLQEGPDGFPASADLLRFSYYPLVLAAAFIYLRSGHGYRSPVWLDAAVFGLAIAGLGYELFLDQIVRDALDSSLIAGQVLYPILDLLFIALAVTLGYSAHWRLGSSFWVITVAAIALFATDAVNLSQLASESYEPGSLLDAGWAGTLLLMAIAAQLPLRAPRFQALRGWRYNIVVALGIMIALALLLQGTDRTGGVVLAICGVLVIVLGAVRLILTLQENERLATDNRRIVATAGEGIMRSDAQGHITYVNPAACRMLGYEASEIVGRDGHALMHHSRADGSPYPAAECPIQQVISGEGPLRVNDEVFWRNDGSSFPVDYTAAVLREDGQAVGAVVVFDDVTEQRQLAEKLRYQANHDSLTGLLNRRRFTEEVEAQIAHSRRYRRRAAVVLFDLDSFKFVNDSFGHAAGDAAIQSVAALVGARARRTDAVARLGGDEFALLLREVTPEQAVEVTNSVLSAIRSTTEPAIEASAGIVTFDGSDDLEADELIVGADIALYEAKQRGGHTAVKWDGTHTTRLAWVEEIREALREDRFVLYTQPILDLRSEEITREEVLVRLRDRNGDVIPPAAFLPTAERFGLIRELDRMVLGKAIELARTGRRVSINLSGRSLGDKKLLDAIAAAIRGGVDPDALDFELTETTAIANLEDARRLASRLELLGCGLALDDFGTGFSSLGYLKHIPVQRLKIDREFVSGLTENSLDQYMVSMIVEIAGRLGQTTVAEGVEDAATLAMLRLLGVDCAQGFFIGRPAPAEEHADERAAQRVREVLEAAATSC